MKTVRFITGIGFMTIAFLATNLAVYRSALWFIGWHRPCNCLGNLADALHVPPQVADNVMKGVLAYLLIGSYGTLFWLWRQKSKAVATSAPSGTSAPPPAP